MSNIYISLITKKAERKISRGFSAFCLFTQSRKKSTFFTFLCFDFSAGSCQGESNINVIRSQIKANKTYKEISNLFKQRFPEVRRGFSERNLRLFCSKHGISKLNKAEIDAVIQQCVSEVRLPAFHLSFDFVLLYITLFETNSS